MQQFNPKTKLLHPPSPPPWTSRADHNEKVYTQCMSGYEETDQKTRASLTWLHKKEVYTYVYSTHIYQDFMTL